MPLHLLGKKSWNVYNPESIARVRRDEAAAKKHDTEEEQKVRNERTAQRLEQLRAASTENVSEPVESPNLSTATATESHKKRRRVNGESDTDRELRIAREQIGRITEQKFVESHRRNGLPSRNVSQKSGQVDPPPEGGMRFIDAAGAKKDSLKPWYLDRDHDMSRPVKQQASIDRWGNEDPRRQLREQQRLSASDPLLAMKKGVERLRDNEKQRKEWMQQREQDLREVEDLARRQSRKKRRHSDTSSLEDFNLDAVVSVQDKRSSDSHKRHHHRHSHHHHHRHHQRNRYHKERSNRSPSRATSSTDYHRRRSTERVDQL